jgi:F-box and leucine-rich repeat protein 2/20
MAVCSRLEAVELSHCIAAGDREITALTTAAGLMELVAASASPMVQLDNVVVGCLGAMTRRLQIHIRIQFCTV